jgi:phosphoserine aminotransferase
MGPGLTPSTRPSAARTGPPSANPSSSRDRPDARMLGVPDDYRIGIVPASDTGAVEMAMWSMLGARGTDMLAWESFGAGWVTDVVKQLKLDATRDDRRLRRAARPRRRRFRHATWSSPGTAPPPACASRTATGSRPTAKGLTICDATSAAFAHGSPWDKLDVTTFSWQKVLGGEAAHGMLILSPRAVERLESYTPAWPLPKIFRLTKGGKLIEGIFRGETINTPSMLAVEDYLQALAWARSVGGLKGSDRPRRRQHQGDRRFRRDARLDRFPRRGPGDALQHLRLPQVHRSTGIKDGAAFAKAVAKRLDAEGVAYDIGAYRDAPPGLRIWCGGTVETADIEALLPWLDWAFRDRNRRAIETHPRVGPSVPPREEKRSSPIPQSSTRRPMAPKVLVSDKLSETAVQIFRDRGVEVDFLPDVGKDKGSCSTSSATTTASPSARPPRSPRTFSTRRPTSR